MKIMIDVATPDLMQVCGYLSRRGWIEAGRDGTWIWFDLGPEFRVQVPRKTHALDFERQMRILIEDLAERVEKRSIVSILHDIEETDHGK